MNKTKGQPGEGTVSRLVGLSKQLGVKGLFGGMGARFVMIGSFALLCRRRFPLFLR
jgi:solute carrier family 25 phosphate transporter 3